MQVFMNYVLIVFYNDVKYDMVGRTKLHSLLLCLSRRELERRVCGKTFNERHSVSSSNRVI